MNISKYTRQLEELVNIDCGSHNPGGINEVADRLRKWYEEIGWHVTEHFLSEKTGTLLEISNHPGCEYYDFTFVGHMDTVFPDGTVRERPFRLEGDLAYGPGSEDMKNGDLAMLHVAENLSRKALDSLNICMCYNPDEEIDSIYSRYLLDDIGSRSKAMFIMESAQDNGHSHCIGRKGRLMYRIQCNGLSGHAGYIFKIDAASAIQQLAEIIRELYALADREKDTTVNVGIITGGTAINVVSDKACLDVEMRFAIPEEQQRIEKAVEDIVARRYVEGVSSEITFRAVSPAWNLNEEGKEFVESVALIAREKGIEFRTHVRGGLSDANHLGRVCPCIMDGMGPYGEFAHSEKEYSTISSAEESVRLLVSILEKEAEKRG